MASAFGKAHVPWGKDGSGQYSAATIGCFYVIDNASPMVLAALADVLAAADPSCLQRFRLIDYGAADGGTSLPLMHTIIETLRSRAPQVSCRGALRWRRLPLLRPRVATAPVDVRRLTVSSLAPPPPRTPQVEIEITYEDQPNNDWKSVFYHTQGITKLAQAAPLVPTHHGVYVTAAGTSFFSQAVPSGSVHLALSFTAMHWLSAKPCDITTGLHMTQAAGAELDAFKAQAAADWRTVLLHRAAELAPGGEAVIANFAVSPEGHFLGHTDIGPCMYGTMARLWAGLRDEGTITPAEYDACTFINYYRTLDELLAPLQPGGAAWQAGLRAVSHGFKTTRCPFRAAYRAGDSSADPAAHAKWWVSYSSAILLGWEPAAASR